MPDDYGNVVDDDDNDDFSFFFILTQLPQFRKEMAEEMKRKYLELKSLESLLVQGFLLRSSFRVPCEGAKKRNTSY